MGDYQVTAEAPGFKKTVRTGILLEVGDRPTVDLTLEVGTLGESVEVKGNASLVDASSATTCAPKMPLTPGGVWGNDNGFAGTM